MESGFELVNRISSELDVELFEMHLEPRNFEARLIAEHVTGDDYTQLLLGKYDLNSRQISELEEIVKIRNSGKPLAYILKSVTFRHLDLFVDERVLIPRPETELVVEAALEILSKKEIENPIVVDIGTGSGAIALSIVSENESCHVYATDTSGEALEVAKLNGIGTGSGAQRVHYFCGDLFNALPVELKGKVDLIVSNPPYVGEDERETLPLSVLNFEPNLALFSGESGEDIYRRVFSDAKVWLAPKGALVLEISPRHVGLMEELKQENEFENLSIRNDLTGTARIACVLKN